MLHLIILIPLGVWLPTIVTYDIIILLSTLWTLSTKTTWATSIYFICLSKTSPRIFQFLVKHLARFEGRRPYK